MINEITEKINIIHNYFNEDIFDRKIQILILILTQSQLRF
jgi:hypothetical protein